MDSAEKKAIKPKSVFLSRIEKPSEVSISKKSRWIFSMSDPSKFKNWYLDYVLSDFTYAAFACAVLAMIKVYFKLDWTQFWNSMILFYTVWIAVMVSKIVKRFYNGKLR